MLSNLALILLLIKLVLIICQISLDKIMYGGTRIIPDLTSKPPTGKPLNFAFSTSAELVIKVGAGGLAGLESGFPDWQLNHSGVG